MVRHKHKVGTEVWWTYFNSWTLQYNIYNGIVRHNFGIAKDGGTGKEIPTYTVLKIDTCEQYAYSIPEDRLFLAEEDAYKHIKKKLQQEGVCTTERLGRIKGYIQAIDDNLERITK